MPSRTPMLVAVLRVDSPLVRAQIHSSLQLSGNLCEAKMKFYETIPENI